MEAQMYPLYLNSLRKSQKFYENELALQQKQRQKIMVEVPDEKAPEQLSDAEMELVKKKEGERILAKISEGTYVIALALDGKMKTSEEMAADLDALMTYGKSKIAFVIGGSLGLHDEVLKRADEKLCFGKMTLPHQLMKLVLVEQIYRSFRIIKGEPYHK